MEAVPQSRSVSQGSQSLVMGVTPGKILKVVLVLCGRGSEETEGCEGGRSVLHAGDLLCLPASRAGCHAGFIAHVYLPLTHIPRSSVTRDLASTELVVHACLTVGG